MIKGALFDIDDTLYSHELNAVPAKTLLALDLLREKGIKIGVCTSRVIAEMDKFPDVLLDRIDCKIVGTGATTVIDGKYFKSYVIPLDIARTYTRYFEEHNISYDYTDINGDLYYWGDLDKVNNGGYLRWAAGNIKFKPYEDEEITNLFYFDAKDEEVEYIDSVDPKANISRWGNSGNICAALVDKSFGLLKFCQMYSFTTDEIVAAGDGGNDDVMLEMAGIGIATDDAKENTKKAADYICKKPIEDGGLYEALVDLKIIEESKRMKSYFVELTDIGKSHLNKEDIEINDLEDDEAIIKAEYSMISSGTELSRAFALKQGFKYPVRPGYCMVGRVLDKGKNINANIGDRVFVNAPHASLVRRKHGNEVQGPLIYKIDEDINPIEATAINLLLVAIQGVDLSEAKKNDVVGVFGLGNIGILAACMYKKLGCRVIGIDPVKQRCDLAKSMGINDVICSNDPKQDINKLTDSKGLDISVDVTGLSQVIINCVDNTKAHGEVILLGSPRQSYECDVTPLLSMIHMKNLVVKGAFNNTVPVKAEKENERSLENNLVRVCEMIRNKDIDISKLISKVIDPKDCEDAYYDLMYNKDKVNLIVYDWKSY